MKKWVPVFIQNEIAGLRHFLPSKHFFGFFCQILSRFFGSVFCIFSALGFLEGFLGGLWAQKRVKTHAFLGFLKRLFKAPDGPLGLILVSFVILFWIFCKSAGPKCALKLLFDLSYVGLCWLQHKKNKKNGQFLVPFLSIFGNNFGAHFGTRSAKEGARWAQESHQELQRAKKLHFQKP